MTWALARAGNQPTQPSTGVWGVALALLLNACATPQTDGLIVSSAAVSPSLELTDVPFFPQAQHQCGPASLAMLLNWAGVAMHPAELTSQIYLPRRQGGLQLEILAAARRQGRVAYVLRAELSSLVAEVSSGHPVMVLQNLGLTWHPQWHYAVVIGFDLPRAQITLRSGTEARLVMPLRVFERTWARSDHWAIVVMPPTRLPRTAEELPYLRSAAALEHVQRYEEASQAYRAALARWPTSLGALIGLGNSRHRLGDLEGAELAFRQALHHHPDVPATLNNLAQTLADGGQLTEAKPLAARAVALEPTSALYRATLRDIRRSSLPGLK